MANAEVRGKSIELALTEWHSKEGGRQLEIEYRSELISIPVVRLRPDQLILNPNNARLSAQLDGHPERSRIFEDPFLQSSQETLRQLLQSTSEFRKLRDQLEELGQKVPGVITRDGLLINGNTRACALMDLEVDGIDVAVLPAGTTDADLTEIEMSLQMQRLVHQDYTFTNELLFMRRYLDAGKTSDALGRKLGWIRNKERKVNEKMRCLHLIEEIRGLTDPPIPYSEFDSNEEALKDLDKAYESLVKDGEIDAADRLKWSRIAALLLKVNKDQVRAIDEHFFEDHVVPRVSENAKALQVLDSTKRIRERLDDGLDDLIDDGDLSADEQLDMRSFVTAMVAAGETTAAGALDIDDDVYQAIQVGIRNGAEQVIREQKQTSLMMSPAEKLKEVAADISAVETKLEDVVKHDDFKTGTFEYTLKKLDQAVQSLRESYEKQKAKR